MNEFPNLSRGVYPYAPWDARYIYLDENHNFFKPNVDKYSSPMEHLG